MSAQHTPGPWRIVHRARSTSANGAAVMAGDLVVVRMPMSADRLYSQKEADLCLIAAAPELLEAAEILAALEDPEFMGAGRRTPTKAECARARAAVGIAKATGAA